MRASEARELACVRYKKEYESIICDIATAAKQGKFAVVVELTLSDFVRDRLMNDGYVLTKTSEWKDVVSW